MANIFKNARTSEPAHLVARVRKTLSDHQLAQHVLQQPAFERLPLN